MNTAGGVCCWRQQESRHHKQLERALCDKRMTLIVDDTIDVWHADLPNLCLTRRFIGDMKDDGLMLLASQLLQLHRTFYAASSLPEEGFSLEHGAKHRTQTSI